MRADRSQRLVVQSREVSTQREVRIGLKLVPDEKPPWPDTFEGWVNMVFDPLTATMWWWFCWVVLPLSAIWLLKYGVTGQSWYLTQVGYLWRAYCTGCGSF